MNRMLRGAIVVALTASACVAATPPQPPPVTGPEAPTGFDNLTNGVLDQTTMDADRANFEEIEHITPDGLGPLFNEASCVVCHSNPITGGDSQKTEKRAGHREHGRFVAATVPIANGADVIRNRSLINDQAICPSNDFPDLAIAERIPDSENIRALRHALPVLGDGFVEALADETLLALAGEQRASGTGVHGEVVYVPGLDGTLVVGRFGWKDQHARLLTFAADAYLNEMGITNRLQPTEVTLLCNPPGIQEPNSQEDVNGIADIDRFAGFMSSTKAPSRDATLAATPAAKHGEALFAQIGCAQCHVPSLKTAPAGTVFKDGFTVPAALGGLVFHPFSDFLLHEVNGDGIVQTTAEQFGKTYVGTWEGYSQSTANKTRTPPLWGLRTRDRFMHDGAALTFLDAIRSHHGEADAARDRFERLSSADQQDLLTFIGSL